MSSNVYIVVIPCRHVSWCLKLSTPCGSLWKGGSRTTLPLQSPMGTRASMQLCAFQPSHLTWRRSPHHPLHLHRGIRADMQHPLRHSQRKVHQLPKDRAISSSLLWLGLPWRSRFGPEVNCFPARLICTGWWTSSCCLRQHLHLCFIHELQKCCQQHLV